MLKISNETKVGILATFAIVIVILGINFLKGKNVFSRNVILYSFYPNVDGLSASNPVLMHGLKVGQVDELELDKHGKDNILVKFHIQGEVTIPKNTVAKIVSSDLLGSKAIELVPGNSRSLAERYDTLPGVVEMSLTESINKVVAPVKQKVEKLITSVDTVVTTLNSVFNEQAKHDLQTSFHSVRASLQNLESTTGEVNTFVTGETGRIRNILASVNHITEQLDKSAPAINRAIENFAAISDSVRAANLQQTITKLNQTISQVNTIMDKAQRGEGTLGKLLSDDKLYNNLQDASKDLDKLIVDLKANPGRYVNFSVISIGGGKKSKNNSNTNTQTPK